MTADMLPDSETRIPPERYLAPIAPEITLQSLVKNGNIHDLTLDQKKVLAHRLETSSWVEACKQAGFHVQRHYAWVRTNAVYAEACKSIGESLLVETRAHLDDLLPRAADAYDDALNTELKVEVTCPCGCGHTFDVRVPDKRARIAAAKDLLVRTGDFASRLKVEGEVKHREMSLEDRLALAQVSRGQPIPPDVYDDLRRRGMIPEAGPTQVSGHGSVIEGASKLIE